MASDAVKLRAGKSRLRRQLHACETARYEWCRDHRVLASASTPAFPSGVRVLLHRATEGPSAGGFEYFTFDSSAGGNTAAAAGGDTASSNVNGVAATTTANNKHNNSNNSSKNNDNNNIINNNTNSKNNNKMNF